MSMAWLMVTWKPLGGIFARWARRGVGTQEHWSNIWCRGEGTSLAEMPGDEGAAGQWEASTLFSGCQGRGQSLIMRELARVQSSQSEGIWGSLGPIRDFAFSPVVLEFTCSDIGYLILSRDPHVSMSRARIPGILTTPGSRPGHWPMRGQFCL